VNADAEVTGAGHRDVRGCHQVSGLRVEALDVKKMPPAGILLTPYAVPAAFTEPGRLVVGVRAEPRRSASRTHP
jgi:hypothetical protein